MLERGVRRHAGKAAGAGRLHGALLLLLAQEEVSGGAAHTGAHDGADHNVPAARATA